MQHDTDRRRVVILGGGFGGLYTALHLERRLDPARSEVTLVSRDNYFLMTPLLFEAGSGAIELQHAVSPVRSLLKTTRFVNAAVEGVDLDARVVRARSPAGDRHDLGYDQLVLALGQETDTTRVPGSRHALTYKTVLDAVRLRNQVIEQFERADAEPDAAARRRHLTLVVVGGGLVGVELMGELTQFTAQLMRSYPRVRPEDVRLVLLQHGPRVLPEMAENLAAYAARKLQERGVAVRTATGAEAIEPGRVRLPGGEVIEAGTVVLVAGLAPNPVVAALDVPKRRGRVVTDACMRVDGRPGVWALGDCALIPGPDGEPYPTLAQHALREAKRLARNIAAVTAGGAPAPFVYRTLGTMAALGRYRGVASLLGFGVRGFPAWCVWRAYYLMQMPQWERQLRIALDWTVALFFLPAAVKIDLTDPPGAAPVPPPADRADAPAGASLAAVVGHSGRRSFGEPTSRRGGSDG